MSMVIIAHNSCMDCALSLAWLELCKVEVSTNELASTLWAKIAGSLHASLQQHCPDWSFKTSDINGSFSLTNESSHLNESGKFAVVKAFQASCLMNIDHFECS